VKPQSPLVFRLEPELHKRLEECAGRTHLKKYTLAILAIEAAVDAIEQNGYQLVVPIKFDIARVPIEKTGAKISYPSLPQKASAAEERPIPKKKTGT
jgi:predicted DNA-binding protein